MDLESGQPFWALTNGLLYSYPHLSTHVTADVVVIGAGITGALIAHELTRANLKVVVLDGRDVAHGSTSASTALLQYEMDSSLRQLRDWCGVTTADALYWSGVESLRGLEKLCGELPDCSYRSCGSLYVASAPEDVEGLQLEYLARRSIGLPVDYWNAETISCFCDFSAPAALFSKVAGQVDPYRLAHALLRCVTEAGGLVFDRSRVKSHCADEAAVRFVTNESTVTAKWGVIAAGYESEAFLPKRVAALHSTFAFVSEPVADFTGWSERCLIWETARPYLYLRTTADGRLMAGGGDTMFRSPTIRDRSLTSKIRQIEARVRSMFPRLSFSVDYAWAGTFAETPDGLPFIGPHPERPGLLFALCYGGNGITFSMMAASILREHMLGRTHPLADAVAFGRPSLDLVTA